MKYPDIEKRVRKLERSRKGGASSMRLFFVRPGFDKAEVLSQAPPMQMNEEPWFIVLTRPGDITPPGATTQ